MKCKIVILVTSWLMVCSTLAIIFNFSSVSADKSNETSSGVMEDVFEVIIPDESIQHAIWKYQPSFRKIAHLGIFMLLGFCLINAYEKTIESRKVLNYLLSLGTVIICGFLDEFNQSFSLERNASFIDVIIDSLGGFVGILIFIFMAFIIKKFKLKHDW